MSTVGAWAVRAHAAGGVCEVKRQARDRLAQRDGWVCRYCATPVARPPSGRLATPDEFATMATVEHLTPPGRPRTWEVWADLDNLGISCAPCNAGKGTLSDDEYRLVLAYRDRRTTVVPGPDRGGPPLVLAGATVRTSLVPGGPPTSPSRSHPPTGTRWALRRLLPTGALLGSLLPESLGESARVPPRNLGNERQ